MRTQSVNQSRLLLLMLALIHLLSSTGGSAKLNQGPYGDQSRKSDSRPDARQKTDADAELKRAFGSPHVVTVIIELQSEPLAVHQNKQDAVELGDRKQLLQSPEAVAYESQLVAEQENFKTLARQRSPNLRIINELRVLLNAISLEAPGTELASIAELPVVKSVQLTRQYHAVLNRSLSLINAAAAWTAVGGSGSAGQGIKIAILDTGIDKNNPLFIDTGFTAPAGFPKGNPSFTNNKVITARAFLIDSSATPVDQNGHGTNVAGIAAGDLNTTSPLAPISGVAPRAFLGNYRVLDAQGNGPDNLVIQGLQAALTDGFDIANLSLGGPATTSLGMLDQAVENAVAAGMVVVVAAGNSGEDGRETIESPGIAPSAITVASSTNSHVVGPGANVAVAGTVPLNLTNIGATVGQGGLASSAVTSTIGPASYADVNALDGNNRGCIGLPSGSLTGKIALIERGQPVNLADCTFATKVASATGAGALAAIIYNKNVNEGADGGDSLLTMDVSGPPQAQIPSVFIARTNGLALRDWLGLHADAQLSLTPVALAELTNPGDLISSFSSRGPSLLRHLKPDLAAPGDQIYSGAITTANANGVSDPSGFAAVSGTSQASPHVAGAAALLKQLHPSWIPLQIKSALISSASNGVFSDSLKTTHAGVLDTGAGRSDLALATTVAATFSPASLSFGNVSVGTQVSLDLQIMNQTAGPDTFTVVVQNLNLGTGVSVSSSAPSVSPAAGQTATVTITFACANPAASGDRTGYIVITDQSNQTLGVPYWGFITPPSSLQFVGTIFSITEGDPPAGIAQVVVARTGDTSNTVSVDFATSDGTASQRNKYITTSGTLTFAPGQTQKSFNVITINNGYVEDTLTINLHLSNPIGALLGMPNQAIVSIDDDEEAPATTNPLDDPRFFVRQHYYDFLSRIPDSSGLNFWTGEITNCSTDQACARRKRIDVSNAFFYELEFQQTGAYTYRLYRAAYGNDQPFPNPNTDPNFPNDQKKWPLYLVFSRDRAKVTGGAGLAALQLNLANAFVQRPEFLTKYPGSLATADQFVDAVLATLRNDIDVDLSSERGKLITLYNSGGRGAVMYRLADDNVQTDPIDNRTFIDKEYNRAFVYTQYAGYLRRNADLSGINFWLGQVNSGPLRDPTKQNGMVCSFITSKEYQERFSAIVTHNNGECVQ